MLTISDLLTGALLAEGGPEPSPFGKFFFGNPFMLFVIIGLLFYFMLIRPERRKRAEVRQMLDNLKKNDRVVTIGGIYGVVVNVQQGSEDVTIRVDEGSNTRLRVLRSAISRVITSEEGDDKKDAK